MGVGLLWDVGALGSFHLETTRLPPRDKPYNLNVELARFRLMKVVQKQEDWNLFDFPRAERLQEKFKLSQGWFSDALGQLDNPAMAAKLADESLVISIELSEELALFHSDLLLNRRRAANTFVKHVFGCRVDCAVQNTKYRETPAGHFDHVVVPTSWKLLQPQEATFSPEPVDAWIETLSKRRVPIIAGPLINLLETDLPDWMFIWENDFETLRELAYEHVRKIVQRYRKAVTLWNVVGGIATNRAFTLTFEQMIELTRMLVSEVKNLLPNARTLINVTDPFGEYHAKNPTSVAPILYAIADSRFHMNFAEVIPDFVGSEKATDRLVAEPSMKRQVRLHYARQLPGRSAAADADRRQDDGGVDLWHLSRLPPARARMVPAGARALRGLARWHRAFRQADHARGNGTHVGRFDFMVTGASAVSLDGVRFGKGHGFFDLEWGMFTDLGIVDETTPVAASVHDVQVVEDKLLPEPYRHPRRHDRDADPPHPCRAPRPHVRAASSGSCSTRSRSPDTPPLRELQKMRGMAPA